MSDVLKVGVLYELRDHINVLLRPFTDDRLHDLNPHVRGFGGETVVVDPGRSVTIHGFQKSIELFQVIDVQGMINMLESDAIIAGIVDKSSNSDLFDKTEHDSMFLEKGFGKELFLVMQRKVGLHHSLKMFGLALIGSRQVFWRY